MKKITALLLALVMVLATAPAFAYTMSANGELPICDETQTLSILLEKNAVVTDYDDNYFTQMVEAQCNIDLTFEYLPSGEANTKLNVMISSGEALPDVIDYGISRQDAYNYATAGALIPLDDLIAEYGVNFPAISEKYPELMIMEKCTCADGHIYGVPHVFYALGDSVWQNCWINKVWLENLNLEMPTTTDELYDVLVAFRDQDPNGNGEADEIALTGATSGWSKNVVNYLLNSFVYMNGNDYYMVDDDGSVYPVYNTEAYKAGLTYIHRLWAEGLLDNQSLTQTADQEMAMVQQTEKEDYLGCWMNMSPRKPFDYTNLAPVASEYQQGYTAYAGPSVSPVWFITADCEDPALAYRVADYMFNEDLEFNLISRYGEKDVYWADVRGNDDYANQTAGYEAGFVKLKDETGYILNAWNDQHNEHWQRANPAFYYGWDNLIAYCISETDENDVVFNQGIVGGAAIANQLENNLCPTDKYFTYIVYTEDETVTYNDIKPDLYTYVDECKDAFVSGTMDIEADWDSYIATLESLRLGEFTSTVQAAYDRMYK